MLRNTVQRTISMPTPGSTPSRRVLVAVVTLATLSAGQSAAQTARASASDQPRIAFTRDSSDWRVELPARYQAALDKVAPGFRPLSAVNWSAPYAPTANGPSGAQVVDLDGDGAPEVALAGTVRDSMITVVLLSATPAGVRGQVVSQEPWYPVSRTDATDPQLLALVRTPDGKHPRADNVLSSVRERGATFIRWQDPDCKGPGWEWRVLRGTVVRTRSNCRYGE